MSESAESACFALNSLPELPFRRIVSFLSPGDLLRLASVSRELFELIRRDDSLWVAHLEEYAFGRWDEVLKDVSVLDGDPYISDWFSHHFRKLHHHRQKAWRERNPEKKEVRFPKGKVDETSSKRRKELTDEEKNGSSSDDYENAYESWIRIHDPLFTIERTILQASYEQYEDDPSKLPAGVLRRRYVYDIGLYKRKNPTINFRNNLTQGVIDKLTELGQGRERDLLCRKHRFLQTNYVTVQRLNPELEADPGDPTSCLDIHFPVMNGIPMAPLFSCRVSQVGTTSLSSVCGVTGAHALRLQLYVEANFDAHFRNYRKDIAAETRQIDDGGGRLLRRFCNEMELFEAEAVYRRCPKNLQTLKKKTPLEPLLFDADCLLEGGKSNSEAVGNLVKLIPFSSHRNGRWRRMWRSWLLEDPTVDRFVAISRWKIRQRLNRMAQWVLFPPEAAGFHDLVRVDLTDAEELDGNNSKQEMVSCVLVSPSAVLLVMQLVGKNRL